MRRVFLLFASTFLATGAAHAAGQVLELPASGPAWQGMYIGGHVGVGMQTVMENYPDGPNPEYLQDIGGEGFIGGVFVGHNWLVAPRWILGVEAEANAVGVSGLWNGEDDPATRQLWSVAARARGGYLVNSHSLLYGSIGWSYGAWESEYISDWDQGDYGAHGLQLGFGIETFATDRLSLRLESIFTAYQDKLFPWPNPTSNMLVDAETLVVRIGAAYHFGAPGGAVEPMPAYDWSGFHAGLHGGAGMFNVEEIYAGGGIFQDIGGHGAFGGAFAGFNWQVSPSIVVGVEGEGNLGRISGYLYGGGDYGPAIRQDWSVAARARVGYLLNPATLVYASAGFAVGEADVPVAYLIPDNNATQDISLSGLQAGLGIETRLNERVSLRAEGIYSFFGQRDVSIEGLNDDLQLDFNTLTGRIGVVFHF